jgi:hypothetical protein
MEKQQLHQMATSHGLGGVFFGGLLLLAPRLFIRLTAFPGSEKPAVRLLVRLLGLRDLILGLGSLRALNTGGRYSTWMLARAIGDAADSVGNGVAIIRGWRRPAYLFLEVGAVASALYGAFLYRQADRLGE